ncbi:MAG: signal peptidase I [Desulfarculus sp.]|nr:signal peptidase I [Pseudomonadota bacterium]MBV1717802.1 signal peptidase I [Desulfarculus sp.]MBU4576780.1 signal peptidase I [Pseudomonadota bacterium]MBU4596800.1 signal peptidase I [Pseudomonadota bacterium]MBV1740432.1 signal peptidase I [Desulfarculus sp.]
MKQQEEQSQGPLRRFIRGWGGALLWALVISAVLRAGVVQASWVPSGSMEPTLLPGDHMLVNKLCYDLKLPFTEVVLLPLGEPKRGDVVVFTNPTGHGSDFVKRIVGLPGETIEMRGKTLYVNGRMLEHDWGRYTPRSHQGDHFGPFKVPPKSYFMMGDNRDNSFDSRFWNRGRGGFVPRNEIVGRAEVVLWSWKTFPVSLRLDRLAHLID